MIRLHAYDDGRVGLAAFCDTCGEQITEHGFVIWRYTDDDCGEVAEWRVIHQARCDPGGTLWENSMGLEVELVYLANSAGIDLDEARRNMALLATRPARASALLQPRGRLPERDTTVTDWGCANDGEHAGLIRGADVTDPPHHHVSLPAAEMRRHPRARSRARLSAFVVFIASPVVLLVAFALWFPSTHETKGERIDRLEQQVGELQGRVEKLESK